MKPRATTHKRSPGPNRSTPRRSRSPLPAATRRSSRTNSGSRSPSGTRQSGKGGSAAKTTDHDAIRQWVESHGGHPAIVKQAGSNRGGGGILRIDFPGFSGGRSLKPVSWNQWFKVFDERKLAFLRKENKGRQSRFNKLVKRD